MGSGGPLLKDYRSPPERGSSSGVEFPLGWTTDFGGALHLGLRFPPNVAPQEIDSSFGSGVPPFSGIRGPGEGLPRKSELKTTVPADSSERSSIGGPDYCC